MERRLFPRQDIRGTALKARLVLTGGSLLNKNSPAAIEIDAQPVNLSRSGVCLSLSPDVTWDTLTPKKELFLYLEGAGGRCPLQGRIVHKGEGASTTLGMQFAAPLEDVSQFLLPTELHQS